MINPTDIDTGITFLELSLLVTMGLIVAWMWMDSGIKKIKRKRNAKKKKR